ncbi:MAG: hypothetical protein AAGC66_11105 [Leifsonia sp.]
MIRVLVHASCATAPPPGQECNDTVAFGPTPDWVLLGLLGLIVAAVVAVIVWRLARR